MVRVPHTFASVGPGLRGDRSPTRARATGGANQRKKANRTPAYKTAPGVGTGAGAANGLVVVTIVVAVAVAAVVLLVPAAVLATVVVAVEAPVVAGLHADESDGDAGRLHVDEGGVRPAGAVPDLVAANPVPAVREEDFLVLVLHHLDAGLHDDHRRSGGERDLDLDAHLRAGGDRERQRCKCQQRSDLFHARDCIDARAAPESDAPADG